MACHPAHARNRAAQVKAILRALTTLAIPASTVPRLTEDGWLFLCTAAGLRDREGRIVVVHEEARVEVEVLYEEPALAYLPGLHADPVERIREAAAAVLRARDAARCASVAMGVR